MLWWGPDPNFWTLNKITDPSGKTLTITYTTDSNHFTYLTDYYDPNTNHTHYSFGTNPQSGQPQLLSSISYPDSTSEAYYYNSTLLAESPPICELDHHLRRNGGTEYFTYYTTGQLKTKEEAAQSSTQLTTYVYNATSGRINTITDANGNVTTLGYNDRGLVTSAQYMQPGYANSAHSIGGGTYSICGRCVRCGKISPFRKKRSWCC